MLDVVGASAYLAGTSDPRSVGLDADDAAGEVTVDHRPARVGLRGRRVASPSFGIVPAGRRSAAEPSAPGTDFVGSGGYSRRLSPTRA